MAKKSEVNRSQTVRDFFKVNPKATTQEVIDALAKQSITVAAGLVRNVKSKHNKASTGKRAAKKAVAVAATPAAPPVVETPTKNGGTITLDQVKKVAHTIKTLGGVQRVAEVLEVIKEMGGVKKFKELAEAMSVTATDDIPF